MVHRNGVKILKFGGVKDNVHEKNVNNDGHYSQTISFGTRNPSAQQNQQQHNTPTSKCNCDCSKQTREANVQNDKGMNARDANMQDNAHQRHGIQHFLGLAVSAVCGTVEGIAKWVQSIFAAIFGHDEETKPRDFSKKSGGEESSSSGKTDGIIDFLLHGDVVAAFVYLVIFGVLAYATYRIIAMVGSYLGNSSDSTETTARRVQNSKNPPPRQPKQELRDNTSQQHTRREMVTQRKTGKFSFVV